MTASPWRNVGETTPCPLCQQPFVAVGRQRVCSAACRQAAWRRRHSTPPAPIPPRTRQAATVYECPSCESRSLGQQRCPDCNLFCRRVGPGGPCPHCDEPVALADLLPSEEGGAATTHSPRGGSPLMLRTDERRWTLRHAERRVPNSISQGARTRSTTVPTSTWWHTPRRLSMAHLGRLLTM